MPSERLLPSPHTAVRTDQMHERIYLVLNCCRSKIPNANEDTTVTRYHGQHTGGNIPWPTSPIHLSLLAPSALLISSTDASGLTTGAAASADDGSSDTTSDYQPGPSHRLSWRSYLPIFSVHMRILSFESAATHSAPTQLIHTTQPKDAKRATAPITAYSSEN